MERKSSLFILLMVVFIMSNCILAFAEPTSYGDVTFIGNVPSDLKDVSIIFEMENKTTGAKTGVELSYLNGYRTNFLAEFGDYVIIPQSTKVISSDNRTLNCFVNFVPFTVGTNNPNGDWTWNITVDVTKNFTDDENMEKEEIKEAIKDYITNEDDKTDKENNTTEIPKEEDEEDENSNGITQLVVPSDNKYFPNMTLKQIKDWYVVEVKKFIATDKSKYSLEEYQENVSKWASYCFNGRKNQVKIKYQAMVTLFDKEETKEFFEVQKRLYDFIKEYQEENNVLLNFDVWDDIDVEIETNPSTETNENVGEEEEKVEIVKPSTELETEKENDKANDDKADDDKGIVKVLKKSWLTLLILVGIIIGGVVFRIRYKRLNDD